MATQQTDKMDVHDEDSEIINDKFQCSICLNPFTKPKIIECFHTFCESCLKDYLDNYLRIGDFPCPLCRKRVKIPSNGVNGFISNFYLEEKKVKVQEPEPKKHVCVHHDKDLDLYCTECCVTICSKCFRVDHSGHSVSEIEQIVSMAKSELEEVSLSAKKNLLTLQKYLGHMKSEMVELNVESRKQCDNINEHVKYICDNVKKIGQEFKKEVKKTYTSDLEKLNTLCQDISVMLDQSQRLFDDSSDLLKRRDSHEILDHLSYLKVKCLESENRAHFPVCSVTYPHFVPNKTEMTVEKFGELMTNSRSAEFALFGSKQMSKNYSKWRKSERKVRMLPPTRHELKATYKNKRRHWAAVSVTTPSSILEQDETVSGLGSDVEKSCFELGHLDQKLQKVKFENPENSLSQKSENLSETREKMDSNVNSEIDETMLENSEGSTSKPVSKTSIFGQFSDPEKVENSNSWKTLCDSFTFQFGKGDPTKQSTYPGQNQYDFRFYLNSILEEGSTCRKVHFKTDEYLWVLTVSHERRSKLSLQVDLDTLGLYRVSFSVVLVNLEDEKDSVCREEKCYLMHGVWGPGFKWKNFINLDLLADPNNHFLDVDRQFLIRLTIEDDIYRLK